MISEARLRANRQNARRSTGPRTDAGKSISSRNATRHGLRARSPIIPRLEDPAAWDAHLASTLDNLAPVGHFETALAERAALLLWRLTRVARYEQEVTSLGRERAPDDARDKDDDLFAVLEDRPDARQCLNRARARLRALAAVRLPPSERIEAGTARLVARALAEQVDGLGPAAFAASFVADGRASFAEYGGSPFVGRVGASPSLADGASPTADDGASTVPDGATPPHPSPWTADCRQRLPQAVVAGDQRSHRSSWTAHCLRRLVADVGARLGRDPDALLADAFACARKKAAEWRADVRREDRRSRDLRRERVLPGPDQLNRVIRYEHHLGRQLDGTLAQLRQLQHPRKLPLPCKPPFPLGEGRGEGSPTCRGEGSPHDRTPVPNEPNAPPGHPATRTTPARVGTASVPRSPHARPRSPPLAPPGDGESPLPWRERFG